MLGADNLSEVSGQDLFHGGTLQSGSSCIRLNRVVRDVTTCPRHNAAPAQREFIGRDLTTKVFCYAWGLP